jgi:hypothetical protein
MAFDASPGRRATRVRLRRLALLGVTALFLLGLMPSGAAAAIPPPSDYYGANIQDLIKETFVSPSNWGTFIATMGEDNLNTARMDALWDWAEPNPPVDGKHTYVWNNPSDEANSLDHLVGLLAESGVRMIAVLDSPPTWAAGSGTSLAPAYYGDFAAFSAAFAARYGLGGTFWAQNPQLPYLPVEQFEVWTEANSDNFWTTVDPETYLQALEPLSTAVHAVDPSAQILASIGWQNFQQYVTELYQDGAKDWINGIGFHPYAPDASGITLLTEQLRSIMTSFGDSSPIGVTEIGQPDATSGPGAQFAYDGPVSDAARAATLSLAGDALAHSDCNVQSFDLYGLVSSGTGLEQYGQGYMSLFDYTTDTPNVTGSAIIAASQRWQGSPAQGLVMCGTGPTPTKALLPLGIQVTHTSPTCVSANITYYGNPIEGAEMVMTTADGRVDPAGTDALGNTQMCLQNGPAITSFNVYAELSSPLTTGALTSPNIAISPTYTCAVTTALPSPPCTLEGTPTTTSAVATRRCALGAALLTATRRHTQLKARLTCKTGKAPSAHAEVYLERKGQRTETPLASVLLAKARWRKFSVLARLHAGDHLIVEVQSSTTIGLPSVKHTLTATRRFAAAEQHKK